MLALSRVGRAARANLSCSSNPGSVYTVVYFVYENNEIKWSFYARKNIDKIFEILLNAQLYKQLKITSSIKINKKRAFRLNF
jgi:hypothetical protein